MLAYGMRFEALADDGVVMRGQPMKLSFAVGNRGPADVTVSGVDLAGLSGASATCSGVDEEGVRLHLHGHWRDSCATRRHRALLDAEVRTRHGTTSIRTRRSACRSVRRRSRRRSTLSVGGAEFSIPRALQFRYDNVVAGEKRMELSVAPAFSVRLAPDILDFPAHGRSARRLRATRRCRWS